jgi:molybdopterin-guanine dinucleotide biosynthesis protein
MVRIPTLDTPNKETDRYRKAGAEFVVAVRETKPSFHPQEAKHTRNPPPLKGLDYVLLEGLSQKSGYQKSPQHKLQKKRKATWMAPL